MDLGKAVGRRIRELRVSRGLTQAELAERGGLDEKHLARIETGKVDNVTVRTLARIAQGLRTTPDELLRVSKAPRDDAGARAVASMVREASPPIKAVMIKFVRELADLGERGRS